jgi:DNA gyrase inhibitor GyrI
MGKIILVSIAILALCTSVYMISTNTSYESADYRVISKDGDFEVREYKPMLLVSTTMKGSELRNNSAFQRLFGYISGSNEDSQKIAMTAPVFSSNDSEVYRMSFLIPKDVAENGAPQPTDDKVKIEPMEGGRFAAYRYSGYSNPERIEEAKQKLAEWVEKQKLKTIGEMLSAGYDPPYTPADRRRNEVLVRLAE